MIGDHTDTKKPIRKEEKMSPFSQRKDLDKQVQPQAFTFRNSEFWTKDKQLKKKYT